MTVEPNSDIANFAGDISEHARLSNGFVLELGPAHGNGSTAAIQNGLAGHPNPLHISVDRIDYMDFKPEVPWWHLIIGDSRSTETFADVFIAAKDRRPGLIFIDTDHTYEQMAAELPLWAIMAAPETIWLFHDTQMFGQRNVEMIRAIEKFAQQNGWVYDDYRTEPHGLGRMRRL